MDNFNELAKLLSRLTALKESMPPNRVRAAFALEHNSIVHDLEKISNESLTEFKIPNSEMYNLSGFKDAYCNRDFLLMKVIGLLGYFTLKLQPEEMKNKTGFSIEEN